MSRTEFDSWFADLTLRFPSVSAWLAKVSPTPERQRATLVAWLGVMADVDAVSAAEVNRKMHAGDMPFVGDYDADKERLPQHVRRLARQLAAKSKATRHASEPERDAKQGSFPAGKLLARVIELVEAGVSSREAKQIALEEFPTTPPKWEPRYGCAMCRDTGRVEVASNAAILASLKGEFESCNHRVGVAVCVCRPRPGEAYRIEQYDAEKDYRVTDFLWGDDETASFEAWVARKREAALSSRRHAAFDSWNERAF